ncbi:UDP-4-amino-4,6-dideoxy-N-acetyl-beta-L-altrosamine transaminase [Salinarimonas sp. NSM]|uniref:UDP-4-amino-4, 6-dideoxy-N-acetyl-beta-L-altrosamine transaminase n=1 Tax=Salinarimonas sp. NSM TaxID=3458003 RepID=UPI0040369367
MITIPYSRQDIDAADEAAVLAVLRAPFLTQGPVIGRFEEAFAARHGVAHAVGVSNATAGLHIACLALGLGPGGRLWTAPNSFVASANCALYCGAGVDFVDIDPHTRNMSVTALREKLERAKAQGTLPDIVVPVDFSGLPADLREIRALADAYGFRILQDASHATGATYLGAPVGSAFADATVFSFHAVKVVTTAEGGMVTTQDDAIAAALRDLRTHGITRDADRFEGESDGPWYYEQVGLGYNYRLTEMQAALGLSQLARIEAMQAARVRLADRYDALLADLPVIRPARANDRTSAWHLYVVEVDETRTDATRADAFAALRAAGIGANVHYIPIHTQPYYRRMGFGWGDFPASEHYYRRAISLPLFPALTDAEQDRVVETLAAALRR